MSAEKRRKMLISFAGLAVVLIAVIAYVSPTFRSENASGAIGVVQKHRAPQIARTDVILGNEKVRQAQKVLYTDYLNDAAALRNLSADVLGVKRADAKATIDNQEADVQAQYIENARAEIAAMQALMNADEAAAALGKASMQNISDEISSLQSALANQKSLESEDMEALNLKLRKAAQTIDSAWAVNLESIERDLNDARHQLEQKNAVAAKAELGRAAARLESASSLGLMVRNAYAEEMAREMKTLENAEETLSALETKRLDNFDEVSSALGVAARELEAKALDNMRASVQNNADFEAALGRFSASVEAMSGLLGPQSLGLDNQAGEEAVAALQGLRSELESMSKDLRQKQLDNEAMAAVEIKSQLGVINAHLDSAARENKSDLDAFAGHLALLNKSVANNAALASALPDLESLSQKLADLQSKQR